MAATKERILVSLPETLYFTAYTSDLIANAPSVDISGKSPTEIAAMFTSARKMAGARPHVLCR